jgi:mRNA interferase MazF
LPASDQKIVIPSLSGDRLLAAKPGDYCPDAGDLVWIDLHPTFGHEQSGHRPAVVLTPRSYNVRSGLCILCPITSRSRGYPFEVAIPHGQAISGVVLADQPRSVSWEKRYLKIAGMASVKLLDEVRERLAVLLQID